MSTSPADRSTSPLIRVSWGEVIEKITILEIKLEKLTVPQALANVRKELDGLNAVCAGVLDGRADVMALKGELSAVNRDLWRIEDDIRDKERQARFDDAFIGLARAVYRTNDLRSQIKRRINEALSSDLVEEKSYQSY